MNECKATRDVKTGAAGFGRYASIDVLQAYTGLGRHKALEIGRKSNAVIKVGRRVVYDLQKIDEYMASLATT